MHVHVSLNFFFFFFSLLLQPLYAGVVSLCEDTEFTITFHRKDTLAAAKGINHMTLRL